MGDFNMKLTKQKLQELIKEVKEEKRKHSMILSKASFEYGMLKKIFQEEIEKDFIYGTFDSKIATPEIMKKAEFNTIAAMGLIDDKMPLNEQNSALEYEVHNPENPNPAIVQNFKNSLYSGKRSGFLTYYKEEDLAEMKLFMVKGHKAGFAIKDGDDIVAVHNNSNGALKGIGQTMIFDAIKNGGNRLDHFDGFLSGFYRGLGFTKVYEMYDWDENYKPDAWDYPSTNIFGASRSVYASSFDQRDINKENIGEYTEQVTMPLENNYIKTFIPKQKYEMYVNQGRPDVIMRKL
jgi:hypothetical protein